MYEYQNMAKYYDLFYQTKKYDEEIDFITKIIGDRKKVLDVGCGTGIHMHLLEEKGYLVNGIDLNEEMLKIAKTRVQGKLYTKNLLDFKINQKYDVILSLFAVFNHLKSYEEFEKGLLNCYNHLKKDGIMIIDLHNGRKSGKKETIYENNKRIMKWIFNEETFREKTNIEYIINGKSYYDTHEFLIYKIETLKEILKRNKMSYKLYENFTFKEATGFSKNIQLIIYK